MLSMTLHDKKHRNSYDAYGADPREIPVYTIKQASRYLQIPFETLRSWVKGRSYSVGKNGEQRFFKPVIHASDDGAMRLSFMNLIEAHVLNGMRRLDNVPFHKVRKALQYIERQMPSQYPLADKRFQTDGVDLFMEHLEQLINISRNGQVVMREVMNQYLRRIDRDLKTLPVRLYPFVRIPGLVEEPRVVLIDPRVSFGKPVLVETGAPTAVIADRFYAGDSVDALAEDYGSTRSKIEEAIRYEIITRQAA